MSISQIQIFNFNSNDIRIQTINDTEYFCAKDVCDVLGYVNGRDAIEKHCKIKGVARVRTITNGGIQKLTFINGENVILLITKCNTATELQKYTLLKYLQDCHLIPKDRYIQTRQEIEFIDTLLKILEPFSLECVKQHQVLNYKIDLYIKDFNIAIEYDEGHHSSQAEEDDIRQKTIEKEVGCKFIRVSNKDSHLWNCGYILR